MRIHLHIDDWFKIHHNLVIRIIQSSKSESNFATDCIRNLMMCKFTIPLHSQSRLDVSDLHLKTCDVVCFHTFWTECHCHWAVLECRIPILWIYPMSAVTLSSILTGKSQNFPPNLCYVVWWASFLIREWGVCLASLVNYYHVYTTFVLDSVITAPPLISQGFRTTFWGNSWLHEVKMKLCQK